MFHGNALRPPSQRGMAWARPHCVHIIPHLTQLVWNVANHWRQLPGHAAWLQLQKPCPRASSARQTIRSPDNCYLQQFHRPSAQPPVHVRLRQAGGHLTAGTLELAEHSLGLHMQKATSHSSSQHPAAPVHPGHVHRRGSACSRSSWPLGSSAGCKKTEEPSPYLEAA